MRAYPPDLVERDRVLREMRDRRSMMSWYEGGTLITAVLGVAAFVAGSIGFGIFGTAVTAFGLGCVYREWNRLRELRRQLDVLDERIDRPTDA